MRKTELDKALEKAEEIYAKLKAKNVGEKQE